MKKFLGFIGGLVLVAALGVGGYFVYKKYIEKEVGDFSITYSYEQLVEGYGNYNVYVKGYKGKSPETVTIAATYETSQGSKPVYGIKANAFKDNAYMKTLDIPGSVQYYDMYIVKNCTSLETVIIRLQEPLLYSATTNTFAQIDLSKVTFKVPNQEMKNKFLETTVGATVVIDTTL